jgi:adenosylmethionine---8-amino-7-oxononanoate aminotransferase
VMCTDAMYGAFYDDSTARAFLHSHSYTGNPLACRAALAVLDIFEEDDVLAVNQQRATLLTQQLMPLRTHPHIRHFRQCGMIWAFDTVDAPKDFSRRFAAAALERELLLRPIDKTVYLMPPYVLDENSSAWLAQGVIDTLNAVLPA